MESIKDYYSVLDSDLTLSELEKLNIPQEEYERSIGLLKKVLWNFSRDVDTVDLIGKTILSMCDSLSGNFNSETGFFNICEMFGGYKSDSDINTLKSYINEIFTEYEEQEYYSKRLPKTKEDVLNLSIPIIAFLIKEKTEEHPDLYSDFQEDNIEQLDEDTGEESIKDELEEEQVAEEEQCTEQETDENIRSKNDDTIEELSPKKEEKSIDIEPIKGQEVVVMDESGNPTEVSGVILRVFCGIRDENSKYIEALPDTSNVTRVAEVVIFDTGESVFVPIQQLIFDFQEDDNQIDFYAPILINETNEKQNSVKKNDDAKYKLNGFLQFILIGGVIGTIIKTLNECVKYSLGGYILQNTSGGGISVTHVDIYPEAFYIVSFIMATIHITGLLVIFVKKSITGLYIVTGGFVCSLFIQAIMNNGFGFSMFNMEYYFISGIIQISVLLLLLLLRKNGLSAYEVFKKINEKKQRTTTTILWIISGLVVFFVALFVIISLMIGSKNGDTNYSLGETNPYISSSTAHQENVLFKKEFNGLTFDYYDNWMIETEILRENIMFSVLCENKTKPSEWLTVMWIKNISYSYGQQEEIMRSSAQNAIKALKQEPFYTNMKIGVSHETTFNGLKSISIDYSGSYNEEYYYGNITSFIASNNDVCIIKQSDKKESLKTSFTTIENSIKFEQILQNKTSPNTEKQANFANSKIPKDWTLYKIGQIGQIAIPPTMELLDENSAYALHFNVNVAVDLAMGDLVFQPKGTNKLDKESIAKYARVYIQYEEGEKDDYPKYNKKYTMTDLKKINERMKDMCNYLNNITEIRQWEDVKAIDVNGISAITFGYVQEMSKNLKIKATRYHFYNSDVFVDIIIFYQTSESSIWADDFSKIASTFNFTTRK